MIHLYRTKSEACMKGESFTDLYLEMKFELYLFCHHYRDNISLRWSFSLNRRKVATCLI